jgi:putative phage-type endonuclease
MVQRSDEWYEARRGKITASKVEDILKGPSGKYRATRQKYMIELVGEILTGITKQLPKIKAVEWGVDVEVLAKAVYELHTDSLVQEVGFILHPEMEFLGASPDALVGEDGGLEIKCTETTTHLALRASGKIDPKYLTQIQVGLMCTGRKWWDFMNYDPRLPDDKAVYIKRIERDEAKIKEITEEVQKFKEELDAMVRDI